MPTRPPSVCTRRGCRGLVRDGVCSVCGPRRQWTPEDDANRGTPAERGYDRRWQRVRQMHLIGEPTCRMCGRLAVLVDHITPIADGGEPLDDANLQSLCRMCHDRKTAADLQRRRMGRREG